MPITTKIAISSKRKAESQHGPLTKKPKECELGRKLLEPEEAEPLKIIGVNDDCLEHVFGYLDATALNNVADAHSRFVKVARIVFKRKYSDQWICIRESGQLLSIFKKKMSYSEIVNVKPKPFLTNFGDLIQKLILNYKNDNGFEDAYHWRKIEQVIYEHCTDTLKEVTLDHCRGNVMEAIRKPFLKVEKLFIDSGFVEPTKVDSRKWFPNITHLNVLDTAVHNAGCIKGHFGRLEYAGFRILNTDEAAGRNIQEFIISNPHIVNLFINSKFRNLVRLSVGFLEFMSETLTQLHTLCLRRVEIREVGEMKHINFPSVKNFCLHSVKYPENVRITFDQLEKLDLWYVQCHPDWTDFILQNKTITKLLYSTKLDYYMKAEDLIKIVNGLESLNCFHFGLIRSGDFIPLLKTCKSLPNLKTIGKVNFYDDNLELKDEMEGIQNAMDYSLKKVFKRPILQQGQISFLGYKKFQSIDICRSL